MARKPSWRLVIDASVISSATRDERARELFRRAASRVGGIRQVSWANPVKDQDLVSWLGGEAEPAYLLGEPTRDE